MHWQNIRMIKSNDAYKQVVIRLSGSHFLFMIFSPEANISDILNKKKNVRKT